MFNFPQKSTLRFGNLAGSLSRRRDRLSVGPADGLGFASTHASTHPEKTRGHLGPGGSSSKVDERAEESGFVQVGATWGKNGSRRPNLRVNEVGFHCAKRPASRGLAESTMSQKRRAASPKRGIGFGASTASPRLDLHPLLKVALGNGLGCRPVPCFDTERRMAP